MTDEQLDRLQRVMAGLRAAETCHGRTGDVTLGTRERSRAGREARQKIRHAWRRLGDLLADLEGRPRAMAPPRPIRIGALRRLRLED